LCRGIDKIGIVEEGRRRRQVRKGPRPPPDVTLYGLLVDEWASARSEHIKKRPREIAHAAQMASLTMEAALLHQRRRPGAAAGVVRHAGGSRVRRFFSRRVLETEDLVRACGEIVNTLAIPRSRPPDAQQRFRAPSRTTAA